ncbi:MAG TPA: alkaline phosphatase D family protein [Aquabacterium sp.]|uniref:alkaline phosphatase D family protein n=1 Tax=Aquabacterium sp. TaxID=1872578 RepID=UPI002E353D18|nr:alkaline phosphatase D family protein [Aquabacterium sp.]HEX5373081.1 alkaline phosphatase D family protein [Aquabacterium sp.]
MQRRDFLSGASRAAALWAWTQVFARPVRAETALRQWVSSAEVFTLGVASGEPLPASVVIWTRLAPKPLQPDGGMPPQSVLVRWEMAEDARFTRIVRQGEAVADPARGHSVHVEVEGLRPARIYHYRFIAGGQSSPVGRTRTAPEPSAEVDRLRFVLASCQHYEMGHFTAHREIAASDIDFVLFVGDYIYETEAPRRLRMRQHRPEFGIHFALPDYRVHHAMYKLDADLRACHAAHPWLLMWDDHEVRNDYDGLTDPDGDLSTEEFSWVRRWAYQAYFEHMPVSPKRAPVGPHAPMYTQYQWGQLADLWLLDTRQHRDANVCMGMHAPFSGRLLWKCDEIEQPARSMLGARQEAWFADALARSAGHWRLIGQTTQMSPGVFRSPLGELVYSDGWDAFPKARERLMAAIAQPRVPDVVCLGGDVHRHVAANLRQDPRDPASPIIASEFVTSSITSKGLSELLNSWLKGSNPDLLHVRSDERGYSLFDVTPELLRCDFRATAFPVRADARFHTQASYVVERGVAGPRKV